MFELGGNLMWAELCNVSETRDLVLKVQSRAESILTGRDLDEYEEGLGKHASARMAGCEKGAVLNTVRNANQFLDRYKINKESVQKLGGLPPCPPARHPKKSPWSECFGTFTFADGTKYVGEFKNDKYHGQGTFTFGPKSKWAGDKYVGEHRDNKRNGQGTYTFANGDKYVGEWKDGKKHGQATYTFANGKITEGIWADDKFLSARKPPSTVTAKKTATYNPEHLKKLRETNSCPHCNLQEVNLRGADLRGARLWGADLSYANLYGANLQGANLQTAYLIKANLYGANLQGIDLIGADLAGAKLDPEGIKIAKASGATNIPSSPAVVKNSTPKVSPIVKKKKSPLDRAKEQCAEIGFTKGTEKFGDCVMKLLN
ncbi:MAG: hypothetical protein CMM53_11960 [Rhodospirillaceae bacterium]|nr:hypothetical protein [Rhodospirillaceae bacterium]|tara:strand:- start:309 stop:1427 length:1119 start_codon:yes stop_codon:yes gene_type:complete